MKLEKTLKVCIGIAVSVKNYYIIGQQVYYIIGRFYYIIGHLLHYLAFFLHYRAVGHVLHYRAIIYPISVITGRKLSLPRQSPVT